MGSHFVMYLAKVKGLIMTYLKKKSFMLTKLPEYILMEWDIVPSVVQHTSINYSSLQDYIYLSTY